MSHSAKIFLLVVITLLPLAGFGQGWYKLYQEAEEYLRSGNTELAITTAEQSLQRFLQEDGAASRNQAAILRFLTTANFSHGAFSKCIDYGNREVEILENLSDPDPEMLASAYFNLAYALYIQDDFEEAIAQFKNSLELLKEGSALQINAYWVAGSTFYQLGETEKALEYLNNGFAAFGNKDEISMDYLSATFNLGMVYMDLEEYQKALEWLLETREIHEATSLDDTPEFANVLEQIGICHQRLGDCQKAIIEYDKASALGGPTVADRISNRKASCLQALGRNEEAAQLLAGQSESSDPATLNNLAAIYQKEGKTDEAEALYQKALNLLEPGHSLYGETTENLGMLYLNSGRINLARPLLESAITLARNHGEGPRYASSLQKFALLLLREGNLRESEQNYRKAYEILQEKVGDNDLRTAQALEGLGTALQTAGRFSEANETYNQSLAIYRKHKSPDPEGYSNLLNNFAALKEQMGMYTRSKELLEEALTYAEKKNDDLLSAQVAENLGTLLLKSGAIGAAAVLFENLANRHQALYGKESVPFANTLLNLARIDQARGNYQDAEPKMLEAVRTLKKIGGEKSAPYATSLNSLALLYQTLGNYDATEPLFNEARKIYESQGQTQTIAYATILENLATLYQIRGLDQKALPLLEQASEIDKSLLGPLHPTYATTLHNMATIYQKTGKLDKAEALFSEGLLIYEKTVGKQHPSYAGSLYNLAVLYQDRQAYSKAEEFFKQALELRRTALGTDHPDFVYSQYGLAALYFGMGSYDKAAPIFQEVIKKYQDQLDRLFPSMSEREKTAFYTKIRPVFETYQDFAVTYALSNSSNNNIIGALYNLQLSTKALLLNATNKVRERILGSNDSELIALFNEWIGIKEEILQQYSFGASEGSMDKSALKALENKANDLEKQLSSKSSLFAREMERTAFSWKEIKNNLKNEEAAIEIIRIKKRFVPDSVMYVALIVTKESQTAPELLILDHGNALEDRYYKFYKNTIYFRVENPLSYQNFFKKIQSQLQGKARLFISLDGVYNKVNLNTLLNPETGRFVIDDYDIKLVSNTKELIEKRPPVALSGKKNATFFGYPQYLIGKASVTSNGGPLLRSSFQNIFETDIPELPGTLEEVRFLARLVSSNGWGIKKYLEAEASEEALKNAKNPYVVHIATHGFFLDDQELEGQVGTLSAREEMENPLFRSGLLFAGASNSIFHIRPPGEDGILTAYEAMNLSLDETELVVLSACETAMGEVKNGEGVYGLQRAFLVAGARSIIMSLWKVDDDVTKKLMQEFYQSWVENGDKQLAFLQAQKKIKNQYPDPYYWGAFVLSGQ